MFKTAIGKRNRRWRKGIASKKIAGLTRKLKLSKRGIASGEKEEREVKIGRDCPKTITT